MLEPSRPPVSPPRKSTIVRSFPRRPSLPQRLARGALRGGMQIGGRIAPEAAACWAAARFLTPTRHPRPEREEQWLASLQPSELQLRDHRLAVWSGGPPDAPAALLLHGWEGRGSQLEAFGRGLLGRGFRVILVDAPGHGSSSGDSSSLVEIAETLREVAWRHGPLYAVVAHSAGGASATWALANGLEVERLVYVAPGTHPERYIHLFTQSLGMPPQAVEAMRRLFEARFGVSWEELRSNLHAPQMTSRLLVIHDRGDRDTHWRDSEELVDSWPGARLHLTDGLGHRRILRDPDVVERAVSFLSEDLSSLHRQLEGPDASGASGVARSGPV